MVTAFPVFSVSCICKRWLRTKIDQDPGDTSVTRLYGVATETEIMGDSAGYPPKEPKIMGDSAGYPPKEPKIMGDSAGYPPKEPKKIV